MKNARLLLASSLLFACAPGDPVGKIDALKPSSLDVALAVGDKLRFRVDTEAELISRDDQGLTRRRAVEYFARSQLVVTVRDPKGERTVRCPLKGNGTAQGMSGSKIWEKGRIVSCEVPTTEAGRLQVSATVAWDPAIEPLSATVAVRRVKK